ncbi:MAG TPA: histidine phosphatase family protein, partial [Desulfomonilaceae bacterium]|nr:histidine phosphatase family protein [Desulfomonilaceae bacterium]
SPLGRAVTSAGIYTAGTGLQLHIRDALAELACGTWENRERNEVTRGPGAIRYSWFDKPPGGESYGDAEDRVASFIRELHSDSVPDRVLVVGHAGINRVLLRLLLDLAPESAQLISCPHNVIYVVHGAEVTARSTTGVDQTGFYFEE